MLRITVELVPYGDETKKRKIGEMVIANDLGGDHWHGNYQGWVAADDWSKTPSLFGKVVNHDRSKSVWELIKAMIHSFTETHSPDTEEESISQRLKKRLSNSPNEK